MRNRLIARALVLAAILLAAAPPAAAKDKEFSLVADCITRTYQGKQRHRFLLKLAGFATNFAGPAGLKRVKLAIFENLQPAGEAGRTELEAVLREGLDPSWRPVVRTFSRLSDEQTFIYSRISGKNVDLFIVTIGSNEATVLKARVDPEKFLPMVMERAEPVSALSARAQ
jgi:hypothetical protein